MPPHKRGPKKKFITVQPVSLLGESLEVNYDFCHCRQVHSPFVFCQISVERTFFGKINLFLGSCTYSRRDEINFRINPLFYLYSGDLKNELVWYSNERKLSDYRMVGYSNAI